MSNRGFDLAIATGKSRRGLDRALEEHNLRSHFKATKCADETKSKPDPTMIFEILNELNLKPSEALMVGDTVFDLEMASNAGVASIGVSYGVHEVNELKTQKPIAIVDDIKSILDLM